MLKRVVLLSGGYESTGCLLKALSEEPSRSSITALFINYGQPYKEAELQAAGTISSLLGLRLVVRPLILPKSSETVKGVPVYAHRNASIMSFAKFLFPATTEIWFGCRGPLDILDPYKDSNRQFASRMEGELELQVRTPFILYPKFLVKAYVNRNKMGPYVFSSENYNYGK